MKTVYDFTVKDRNGNDVSLREYQGKVKPVKALLSKNYRYKNHTLIYKKIETDVMQIWM